MIRRVMQLGMASACVLMTLGAGGCSWLDRSQQAAGAPDDQPADTLAAPGTVTEEPTTSSDVVSSDAIALAVQFDVLRIDLPAGEVRHSLKVWNHLDESLGDPVQTALLARNGFRIGVGERSVWSAVRTLFDENDARSTRASHTVQDGGELMIPLGDVAEGDSYFVHGRGGKLTGGAFEAGTKYLAIASAPLANDPTVLQMTVTPRLREHKTQMRYVERGGQIMSVHDQEGMVFGDLAASVALAPGQFLVIGGSSEAGAGYLLGSWWLNTSLDAKDYEVVLCISARTVRVR